MEFKGDRKSRSIDGCLVNYVHTSEKYTEISVLSQACTLTGTFYAPDHKYLKLRGTETCHKYSSKPTSAS